MKSHIGVDAGSGYVKSVTATAANVHDIAEAAKLIRSDDEVVYGDSGYLGIEKREEVQKDEHLSRIDYRINRGQGKPIASMSMPDRLGRSRLSDRNQQFEVKWNTRFVLSKFSAASEKPSIVASRRI